MNQNIFTGIAATLAFVSLISSSQATQDHSGPRRSQPQTASKVTSNPAHPVPFVVSNAAVKVGEHQLQGGDSAADEHVASLHLHQLNGQEAVTLYVHKIPVVTFLGSRQKGQSGIKVATVERPVAPTAGLSAQGQKVDPQDPLWRATTVAARLNQLQRQGLDARSIRVLWNAQRQSYIIQAANQHLLELNPVTILPQPSRDPAQDALQVTNRLRRLLGNAAPLTTIVGRPATQIAQNQTLALGPVRFQLGGIASWYGPGFHGNPTANGEPFNQYALTAAHRSLPFGTRVRVTNLNNGRSVVVRINDRGPFSGDRVIDLSKGAAQVLGVINSGVAPVKLEVLQ